MKKLLLLSLILIGIAHSGKAQVIFTDNFEDGNITANPVWSGDQSNFLANNTSPVLAGTNSVRTSTGTAIKSINSKIITAGSLSTTNLTWRFLYRNNSGTDPSNTVDKPTASNLSWRYWIAADGTNPATAAGYAVIQKGTSLIFNRYTTNSAAAGQMCGSVTITRGVTYSIRITRRSDGIWTWYVDATTGEATTVRGGTGSITDVVNGSSIDIYSMLEANDNSATANRFVFDNISVTRPSLTVGCNTNSLPTNVYGGNSYPLFSFQMTTLANEDVLLNFIYIASSYNNLADGKITSNTITLVQSTDNDYYTTGDNVTVGGLAGSVESTQLKFISNTGYTVPGGTSYYYFVVAPLNNPYTGTGTPPPTTFSVNTTTVFPGGTGSFLPTANYKYTINTYNCSSPTPVIFGGMSNWKGSTSTDWNLAANWLPATVPTINDLAQVGVVSYTRQPTIQNSSAPNKVAALTLGVLSGTSPSTLPITLTVNSGYTLAVTGTIQQNLVSTAVSYASTLAGSGSITCADVQVGDNTNSAISGQALLYSSVASLAVNNNITVTSNGTNRAAFTMLDGTVTVGNLINITNSGTPSIANSSYFTINTANTGTNPKLVLFAANAVSIEDPIYGSVNFYGDHGGPTTTTYNAAGATVYTATTTGGFGSASGNLTGGNAIDLSKETYYNLIVQGAGTAKIGASNSTLLIDNDLTTSATIDAFTYTIPITVGATFTNSGNFTGGAGTIGAATLTNSNVLTAGGGNISVTGTLTNTGTFAGAGGTIATSTLANSGTFTGGTGAITASGLTSLTGGTFTTGSGLFTATGGIDNTTGTFQQGSGNVTTTGSIRQFSGIMNFSAGTVSVRDIQITTGTMNAGTGTLTVTNSVAVNGGTFNAGASPGAMTVASTFSNAGTFAGSTGTIDLNGATFTNTGTFTLAGGTTTIAATTFSNTSPGTFIASAGTVNFDRVGAQAINNTNTTTPVAFYNVNFTNSGTKTLGGTGISTVNPVGILTMAGTAVLDGGVAKMTLLSTAAGSAAVETIPTTGTRITGTFNVQRFVTGGLDPDNRGYRMMSSPVSQTTTNNPENVSGTTWATRASNTYTFGYTTAGTFTGGPGPNPNGFTAFNANPTMYLYNETFTPSNTTFLSGKHVGFYTITATGLTTIHDSYGSTHSGVTVPIGNGFLLYFAGGGGRTNGSISAGPPADATLSATGYINQGTIQVRLWNRLDALLSYTSTLTTPGLCMVGNPYPTTINLKQVATDNNSATGISAIWVLNSRTGGTNQNYVAYTPLGSSMPDQQGYAVSGGGFIVKAKKSGSSLVFKETQKVSGVQPTGSGLIMSAPKAGDELAAAAPNTVMAIPEQQSAPDISGLYMKMEKSETVYDYTGIYFRNGYESKFDDNDAPYLAGYTSPVTMSSFSSDGKKTAVNIMPDYHTGSRVKLNVTATTNGLYQLKLEGVRNIEDFYDIYLMDRYKKDSLDIRLHGAYSFNITTDTASFGANRFELVIRHKPVPQYLLTNFAGAKITEGVNVSWKTVNEGNYTGFTLEKLSKATSQYETLYDKQGDGSASYAYVDHLPNSGINTYRLKQNDIDGRISYSEPVTVFFDKLAGNGLINVFPNPTVEVINVSIPGTMSSASYKLKVYNLSGNLVMQKTSVTRYWTESVSQLQTGVYVVEVEKSDGSSLGKVKFVKN